MTLNVGGTLYSTTLETLTRFPDSMLGAMFRADTLMPANFNPQGDGHYFIDRDGKAFRHILNFLRLGRLDLPRGYGETALLKAEADFYQIRPLLDALRELEASRATPASTAALLHADVDVSPRLVHFSARRGPHHYELSSVQVLQVALEHGFRLDSVFPDPEDLLNSRSLRFVRH